MKTILDKIDPKYIECSTGVCEHISHSANMILWVVLGVALVLTTYKYRHGINT